MARYIFDLESDGFVEKATKVHSLVLKDVDTGVVSSFHDHGVDSGIHMLMEADLIIGHNVIKFDIPLLQKLYPTFSVDENKVYDTLVISRLLFADLSDRDYVNNDADNKPTLPGNMIGSHSLAAWGYRLREHKGDYQEDRKAQWISSEGERPHTQPERDEWDAGLTHFTWMVWTPEMQTYCEQDVVVTEKLWKTRGFRNCPAKANKLEHSVAWIIAQQERNGFLFDIEAGTKLYSSLVKLRDHLELELQDTFPPWEIKTPFTPKVNNTKRGYVKGVPTEKVKVMVFNPGSRDQIADRLTTIHGWKPKETTPAGKPKVDESVLSKLKYPEAKSLAEYFLIQKRIGMLAEGKNGWLRMVNDKTNRIHGGVITNGAVTGRATHQRPNIAQTPSLGAPYGAECRELFTSPEGYSLVGIDVSGLELRMLGHRMHKFDKGKYAKEVIDGDIHTANQKAAGLPTRNDAKRFIYAFLYGCGPGLLADIAGLKTVREGTAIKTRFLQQTPALKRVIDGVQKSARDEGCLVGLDGRKLHCRSEHSALNLLLQSDGALVCKRWMVELWNLLGKEKDHLGARQVAWVHDEVQMEVPEENAELLGKIAVQAIGLAGDYFNIKVPLTGEFNIGNNWKETH